MDQDAREALIRTSGGDCRKIENILQGCAAATSKITRAVVYSLASSAKPEEVNKVLALAVQEKFLDARKLLLDTMLNHGLSGLDMIKLMQQEIMALSIPDKNKVKLIMACGETEFRMTEGSDEYVQLEAFLAQAAVIGKT